jgi:hypothetical protein
VSDQTAIVFEIPLSIFDYSGDTPYSESETAFGNPYLGLKFDDLNNHQGNKLITHLGVRLPVMADEKYDAAINGFFTTYDRVDAFANDCIVVSLAETYVIRPSDSLDLNLSLGGNYWFATGNRNESEFFVDYNLSVRKTFAQAVLGAGFSGKFVATEEGSFDEKTVSQLGAYAHYNGSQFKPGAFIRFPLDKAFREVVDMVFGVRLIYGLQ